MITKAAKPKKSAAPKLSTLQAKADKRMSDYIRQKFANHAGMVTCVSCGTVRHWTDMDCGHFVPKSRGASVRYVEENVHPECPACNRFDEGHLIGYTLYMLEMYGQEKIDELKRDARKVLKANEKRAVVEDAIEYYGAKLKAMEAGS